MNKILFIILSTCNVVLREIQNDLLLLKVIIIKYLQD